MAKKSKSMPVRRTKSRAKAPAKTSIDKKTLPQLDSSSLVVKGYVRDTSDRPQPRLMVRAYDQDLRKSQKLGEAWTDQEGRYRITYSQDAFCRAEKGNADLYTIVFDADDVELSRSSVLFNASAESTIDHVISTAGKAVSEYERLLNAIQPLLIGQSEQGHNLPINELTDKDINFLFQDTGLPVQQIRFLVQAVKSADASPPQASSQVLKVSSCDSHIPTEVFYGWFRLGLPTEPVALWATSIDTLFTTLNTAIVQRIIPSNIGEDLDSLRTLIEQIKSDHALQAPVLGTRASLRDLLTTLPTSLSLEQQRALATSVSQLRPDDSQLVKRIASIPGFDGEGVAAGVARTLRLGALTGGHISLTEALQHRLQHADESEGTLRPLALLRSDEWIDLAYTHGTPEATFTPIAYADTLAAIVERQHPTATLAAHLMEGRRLAHHPVLTDIDKFLHDNPAFDIATENLNAIKEQANWDSVARSERIDEGLRSLQRFHSLGASWDETATLLENDLYGPHQLLTAGPAQLAELLEGQLEPERVVALFNKAEELHTVTFAAFTAALSPLSGPEILPGNQVDGFNGDSFNEDDLGNVRNSVASREPIVRTNDTSGSVDLKDLASVLKSRDGQIDPSRYKAPPPIHKEDLSHIKTGLNLKGVLANQPTLQSLFGSQDACTCGHCSSVLSPAAYFVDLMQFNKNALPNAQLLNRLLLRRPDLQDLELSCNNTNTEVLALDMALEILENAVALPLDVSLPAGTDIQGQLTGPTVGPAVRAALLKTVNSLAGEVRATPEAGDWTVVDEHRRWKLTAQNQEALKAETASGAASLLNIKGTTAAIAALNKGEILKGLDTSLAQLFGGKKKNPPDLSNYNYTIEPVVPGKSWRVSYQFVAQVFLDFNANQLTMRTSASSVWTIQNYNKKTIVAVSEELGDDRVPKLIQELLARRFYKTSQLTVTPVVKNNTWNITSTKRECMLQFTPARLTITSLAYQSGDASADAIAWPENHNPEAYVQLKKAVFPWSLPVDLPLEEVRLFLERARLSRQGLMEVMAPINQALHDDTNFMIEVLRLSAAEAKLIAPETPPSDEDIFANWGLSSSTTSIFDAATGKPVNGAPLDLLKNVSILLQQSRLAFEELKAVISTQFVSQDDAAPLSIEPPLSCKPSEMTVPELTAAHLERMHRFIRLRRRLGWTVHELDLALQAFGGELTPQTLVDLAALKRLKEELNLPMAELVGGLDRVETKPWVDYLADGAPKQQALYAKIFQREEVRNLSDFANFALRDDGLEMQTPANRGLSTHANYIGNCIGVDSSIITEWVITGNALGIADRLDLTNLSRLTSGAWLCHALQMNPAQLTHLLKLLGPTASPFRSGIGAREHLNGMIDFVRRYRALMKAGIDVETLRYVLQHYEVPGSSTTLSEVQIVQIAGAARDAVRSILTPTMQPETNAERLNLSQTMQRARQEAVIAALANRLSSAPELIDELLRKRLQHPADPAKFGIDALLADDFTTTDVAHMPTAPIPPATKVDATHKAKVDAADKAAADVIIRLYKAVFLCNALTLTREYLKMLRMSAVAADGFAVLDFNDLPVAAKAKAADIKGFEQLMALSRLRAIALGSADFLYRYIVPADSVVWSTTHARQVLATGLQLTELEVKAAADQLRLTTDNHYRDPLVLERLIQLLMTIKKLGSTVELAKGLTSSSPSDVAASDARELLRGNYSELQWHDLIKPIADKLRERQRNALVDYLLHRDKLRNADNLYEQYLIDIQTGSCMKTTRLLQATAAVQLFVQRVLLNLEPGGSLKAYERGLWEWMHSYRVWEANRKVFLFPENWLLPELRDDKTAIFREMESTLTEREPSGESTHAALMNYLESFSELAQISVIAMYDDRRVMDNEKEDHTLYVVGRTPNQPYQYFWRACAHFGEKEMSWSGWEALDIDHGNDFIMPFIFEGDLHIAWPIINKSTEERSAVKDKPDVSLLLWEVQMAWTRRTSRGWVKRKLSHDVLPVKRLLSIAEQRSFVFQIRKNFRPIPLTSDLRQETILIDCYPATEVTEIQEPPNPDLSREDALPKASVNTDARGWPNVFLTISGEIFERYTQEGTDIYRGMKEVKVELVHELGVELGVNGDPKQIFSREDGAFNFDFFYRDNNENPQPGIKVKNGSEVFLRFYHHDELRKELKGSVKMANGDERRQWMWTPIVVFEIDQPKDNLYKPDRNIKFERPFKGFVLKTGLDMQLFEPKYAPLDEAASDLNNATGLDRFGNQYMHSSGGQTLTLQGIEEFTFDRALVPPVILTQATWAGVTIQTSTTLPPWYIRDAHGAFFLYNAKSQWQVLPDGQDFVGVYRSIAAVSTAKLLDLESQALRRNGGAAAAPATSTGFSTASATISFDRNTPYANYNWELFLHAPLAIADFLASQQRFADARRWLHTIFDPTAEKASNNVPKFWRFLPFHNDAQPEAIATLLAWLADPNTGDPAVENKLRVQIAQWKENPFMPHLIARLRPSACQWYTFFAYLNVLIKWGDQLCRRDTRESVNEATLLYVLAAKLLGPRPRKISMPSPLPPQTYRALSARGLDDFSNTWIQYADLAGVRNLLSTVKEYQEQKFSKMPMNGRTNMKPDYQANPNTGIRLLTSFSLAFCVPQNEKITEFYDLIEKRLFNLRHCRNIEGVFRELPLYDPPIDPLLLIRARAAGLDIATVIEGLYAPLPNYRFVFTLQKALELCTEVKSLGTALLSAREKQDAEELTLLRSTHEIGLLKQTRDVRQKQVEEANANIMALQQSQATVTERFSQFQKLLGKTGITKGLDGLPVVEQSSSLSVSADTTGGASGLALSRMEVEQLRFSAFAHLQTQIAGAVQVVAGIVSLIPDIFVGTPFAGSTLGGSNFGIAANAVAKSIEMVASEANYLASQAGTFGGYERRRDEWVYQSRLALAELKQLDKQILAAQIRKDITQKELDNHDKQMENAREIDEFMRSKFTNQQLFRWMSSQIAEVYFRTYQLALDQARRAERTYHHELMLDDAITSFVRSDSWDSLKSGLLAGDRLYHDLKRMEGAYLEGNVREFELTRHISLLQLDPLALIRLRADGACDFKIPEALFDLDCPGLYMRRIKMVSLSIPCVTGPYASVSATLRLERSETRVRVTSDPYARLAADQEDSRFRTSSAPTMAIVTSSSQQDSGMFEPSLRDERYLPFEGTGAISDWHLELPREIRQFNYDTIADVILHVRYTARDGGLDLRNMVTTYLEQRIAAATAAGMVRLFSIRYEFPSAWTSFKGVKIADDIKTAELALDLREEHYPFWSKGRLTQVKKAEVIVKTSSQSITISTQKEDMSEADTLSDTSINGLVMGALAKLKPTNPVSRPDAPLKFYFTENETVEDLWLAITWKK